MKEKQRVLIVSLFGFLFTNSFAQVPTVVESTVRTATQATAAATEAAMSSAASTAARSVVAGTARANVPQVPLTAAENVLLPKDGVVTHTLHYKGNEARVKTMPIFPRMEIAYTRHVINRGFSTKYYPSFKEAEKASIRRAIEQASIRRKESYENASFYSALRLDRFESDVAWDNYLPSSLDDITYFYVGEIHQNKVVQRELLPLLRTLRRRNPTRKIYLATEYVPDTLLDLPFESRISLSIATNWEDLKSMQPESYQEKSRFLKDVVEDGFPVVGLDPAIRIKDMLKKEMRGVADEEKALGLMGQFLASRVGVTERNKKWVEHLRDLHAQDPDALIVVHGGGGHLNWFNPDSIPAILEEETDKTFTVLLYDTRLEDIFDEPILNELNQETGISEALKAEKQGVHYVMSLKPADEDAGRTMKDLETFRKGLGADVISMVGYPQVVDYPQETKQTLWGYLKTKWQQMRKSSEE